VRNHVKLCGDQSNGCGKKWPFSIFKMAAVRHVERLKIRNFNSR